LTHDEKTYLRTHLGTLLFYDEATQSIRHGDLNTCPKNLVLSKEADSTCSLIHFSNSNAPNLGSGHVEKANATSGHAIFTGLQIHDAEGGAVGVASRGRFLCATRDGSANFAAGHLLTWEMFDLVSPEKIGANWSPRSAIGGTQLMMDALRVRIGSALDRINLLVNSFEWDERDRRPVVMWIHNEVNGFYDWFQYTENVERIAAFVFVSNWQRQAFIDHYSLPPSKCFVLRNAIAFEGFDGLGTWDAKPTGKYRCAYTSAPTRGLDVLLDGWSFLNPKNAELHIWSSVRLWGAGFKDSSKDKWLFQRAESMPNVIYHGIAPNSSIRMALKDMHFLTYPSTFLETACIATIEAMASGCRVIVPSVGALPETTAGFARVYPFVRNKTEHAKIFADVLQEEFAQPWAGDVSLSCVEQKYCREIYDWSNRIGDWRRLIDNLTDREPPAKSATGNSVQASRSIAEGTPWSARALKPPTMNSRVVSDIELAQVTEIHLINLDRSTDRLAKFYERNAHLTNVVRVPAVDGTKVDRTQLLDEGVISEDLSYSPGALGCAMSHIGLWQEAVKKNRIMTICEDDVVFSHFFNISAREVLCNSPAHWDIVQWGFNHNRLFAWLDLEFSKACLQFYEPRFKGALDSFQNKQFTPKSIRLAHSFGSFAYSVTPRAAVALLESCLPLKRRLIEFPNAGIRTDDVGIDVAMNAVYPFVNSFVSIPPLVVHDDEVVSEPIRF
jgi:GR25 family glycosyltransferase involved in LPS biosynthesis/glycosyltransferase involved in cell wall biosynthesis